MKYLPVNRHVPTSVLARRFNLIEAHARLHLEPGPVLRIEAWLVLANLTRKCQDIASTHLATATNKRCKMFDPAGIYPYEDLEEVAARFSGVPTDPWLPLGASSIPPRSTATGRLAGWLRPAPKVERPRIDVVVKLLEGGILYCPLRCYPVKEDRQPRTRIRGRHRGGRR